MSEMHTLVFADELVVGQPVAVLKAQKVWGALRGRCCSYDLIFCNSAESVVHISFLFVVVSLCTVFAVFVLLYSF